jgi:hypothetical protein
MRRLAAFAAAVTAAGAMAQAQTRQPGTLICPEATPITRNRKYKRSCRKSSPLPSQNRKT